MCKYAGLDIHAGLPEDIFMHDFFFQRGLVVRRQPHQCHVGEAWMHEFFRKLSADQVRMDLLHENSSGRAKLPPNLPRTDFHVTEVVSVLCKVFMLFHMAVFPPSRSSENHDSEFKNSTRSWPHPLS